MSDAAEKAEGAGLSSGVMSIPLPRVFGRLLLLNRRFSIFEGLTAKLVVADPGGAKAGGVLTGAEIAHFEAPLTVDNMEALSVTREGGRTFIWIASDDNFSAIQRTLLLKFALTEDTTKAPQP